MTAAYDPELCARLVSWVMTFTTDPGTSTDERVVLLRDAIRELLAPTLVAMADQLEAARAEIDSLRTAMEVAQSSAERRGAERDKLQAELAATRTILAATERTVASGAEALEKLRAEWQRDRVTLQADNEHSRREAERAADEPAERSRAVSVVHRMRPIIEAAEQWRDHEVDDGTPYLRALLQAVDAYRAARDKCGICGAQITNLGITCLRGCPADDGRGRPRGKAGG